MSSISSIALYLWPFSVPSYLTYSRAVVFQTLSIGCGIIRIRPYIIYHCSIPCLSFTSLLLSNILPDPCCPFQPPPPLLTPVCSPYQFPPAPTNVLQPAPLVFASPPDIGQQLTVLQYIVWQCSGCGRSRYPPDLSPPLTPILLIVGRLYSKPWALAVGSLGSVPILFTTAVSLVLVLRLSFYLISCPIPAVHFSLRHLFWLPYVLHINFLLLPPMFCNPHHWFSHLLQT